MDMFLAHRLKKFAAGPLFSLVLTGAALGDTNSGSQAGWNAYLQSLDNARSMVDRAIKNDPLLADGDSLYRAEGYRWVIRWGTNLQASYWGNESNPGHPVISRCPTQLCKLGWDNPDYTYISVGPLSPEYTYRVFGNRNDARLMLFQIMNHGGFGGGDIGSSESLKVDANGNWEIYLSASKPARSVNWLRLDERSGKLLVRNIFGDWNEREPSIQVEVVSGPDTPPPSLTPDTFSQNGLSIARQLEGAVSNFIGIFQAQKLHEFPTPCTGVLTNCEQNNEKIGGFRDILYTVARYHVPEGKALIISVPAAQARYRNIQLGNVWTESQDYINRQTSLNSTQDHLDEDNVYRYVLAHEDPEYANWLDISDHAYGSIMMRWIFSDPDNPPQAPVATLINVEDLADHMPDSHRRVDTEERRQALRERRQGANKRFNPAGL